MTSMRRPEIQLREDPALTPAAPSSQTIRLTIPARPEYVPLCRLALAGIARLRALGDEDLAELKLALTEACSNAVRHAYADDESGQVRISYELGEGWIAIEVGDDGAGFDPLCGDGESERTGGGLGLAIIRAIADELELDARPGGRGSRVRFVKRLPG